MFVPDHLIIDGTEHKITSRGKKQGNRRQYEIRVGSRETVILLPLRLFYLVGSLAMLRDVGRGASSERVEDFGFVPSARLQLSNRIMSQYIYCTRLKVIKEIAKASRYGHLLNHEYNQLRQWPVFENGASHGRNAHWRCAISPTDITVNPRILSFPNNHFQRIGFDYFRRHTELY